MLYVNNIMLSQIQLNHYKYKAEQISGYKINGLEMESIHFFFYNCEKRDCRKGVADRGKCNQ